MLAPQSDVVLDETAPTKRLHDLGIEATSMEMPGFNFLHRYRSGSHFLESSYFFGRVGQGQIFPAAFC